MAWFLFTFSIFKDMYKRYVMQAHDKRFAPIPDTNFVRPN